MRNFALAAVVIAMGLGWAGQAAMAQEDDGATGGGRWGGPAAGEGRGMRARRGGPEGQGPGGRLRDILTPEQQAEVQEIMQAAREEARDAETPEERREIMEAAREKMEGLLTDEQKAQLPERPGRRGPAVELSDEQQEKIERIYEDALAKAEGSKNAEERIAIYEQVQKDILAVLTVEQAEALAQSADDGLNLTQQQKDEIKAINDAARLAGALAEGPRQRRAIMREAQNDAIGVLTEEQRATLQTIRRRQRAGRGGKGGPGRGGMMGGRGGRGPGGGPAPIIGEEPLLPGLVD